FEAITLLYNLRDHSGSSLSLSCIIWKLKTHNRNNKQVFKEQNQTISRKERERDERKQKLESFCFSVED
ncbi:unnamed protein product, partial [Brassica rapa]